MTVKIKKILTTLFLLLLSTLANSVNAEDLNSIKWIEVSQKDSFSGEDNSHIRISSINKEPVGFWGKKISATIIDWKPKNGKPYATKIAFSDTAMPNASSEMGCYKSNCKIDVKFDSGKIERYEAFEQSRDQAGSAIFIRDRSFIKKSLASNKIEIRISFYQQGDGVFVFENQKPFKPSWFGNSELIKSNKGEANTDVAESSSSKYARYIDAWRQKIEILGSMRMAEDLKSLPSKIQMTVKIKSDGGIDDIEVNKSSGSTAFDNSLKNVIQSGAPYASFSEDMRKEISVIAIKRTWYFKDGLLASSPQ